MLKSLKKNVGERRGRPARTQRADPAFKVRRISCYRSQRLDFFPVDLLLNLVGPFLRHRRERERSIVVCNRVAIANNDCRLQLRRWK